MEISRTPKFSSCDESTPRALGVAIYGTYGDYRWENGNRKGIYKEKHRSRIALH
jgi:hypothetical protein